MAQEVNVYQLLSHMLIYPAAPLIEAQEGWPAQHAARTPDQPAYM